MKRSRVVLWSCGLVVMMLIGLGCGKVTEVPSEIIATFYNNTKNITPEFKPLSSSSSSLKALTAWESGNALYCVFYTLREYLDARDGGKIDRANMYRLLWDVDTLYEGAKYLASTLEVAKVIKPPFDFGNNKTYTKAANIQEAKKGMAIAETDTTIEALVSWHWLEADYPKKIETGVFEATFNKITKDLTVDFVFSIDYNSDDTTADCNQRTKISGNANTHAFEYKSIQGGSSESASLIQMVGKGISKGAGNKFLFKVKSSSDPDFTTARYLVISAEATEDTLKAINVATDTTTEADTLPAEVVDYKNYVTSEAFFSYSQLLVNRNELNKGVTNEGTIYLNY